MHQFQNRNKASRKVYMKNPDFNFTITSMFNDGRKTHKTRLHWPHSAGSPKIIYQHIDIPELLTLLQDLKSAHTAAFPYTRKFHFNRVDHSPRHLRPANPFSFIAMYKKNYNRGDIYVALVVNFPKIRTILWKLYICRSSLFFKIMLFFLIKIMMSGQ